VSRAADPHLDPRLGLPDPLVDRLRHALLDDAEESACDALGEDACTVAPGNAGWNVVSGAFSKLGEQLASPGTVLPWILSAVGAPAAMTGLLVPVKDAGSLLPQLAVAGVLRARPRRARWWVAAASLQTVALAAMAAAVAFLGGAAAGAMIVLALAAFSVASGVGSVAFKDVMAKTVPKGGRGRVLAWRSTIGGIAGVAAGLTLRFTVAGVDDRGPYLLLLLTATACFAASAAAFARIVEQPGATSGRRNALQEARAGLRLLREQPGFRAFVSARALLLAVPLTLPFLTVFGRETMQADLGGLGVFVAANALAASVASPAWGRFADLASHRAMAVGGLIALAAVGYAFAATLLPEAARSAVAYVPVYLLAGIGYAGVRLGRKTYLVDAPPEEERPTYVAIANTAIGGATVLGAGVGLSAGLLGTPGTLLLFSAFTALGCLAAWRLPPAERMHVAQGGGTA
jgi:MFS family permease